MADDIGDAVVEWISTTVGPIRSIDRQQRWRPAWFVTAESNGRPVRLYVRGNREGFGFAGVEAEAAILREMENHGIPVPHVHGVIADGAAVVMDWLSGEADLSSAADAVEIDAVMDDYVDALVRAHRIDPAAFADIGLRVPTGAHGVALDYFETFVERYRSFKQRPEPLLEFAIGWLRRNPPTHRSTPRFVLGDTGQFMFAEGRITGLLDVELAHIGDISHDLAGLRLRNVTEPMGDLGRVLRRYAEVSGEPLDVASIEFHTAKFALCTPLGVALVLHLDLPLLDIVQYIEWFHQLSLHAIESIARLSDVELAPVSLPDPVRSRYDGVIGGLSTMVESLDVSAGITEYQRGSVASVARFCHRVSEFGDAIDRADLADIEATTRLGSTDRRAADQALEAFILDAGPEHDAALVQLLHRRVMRQLLLLEPLLSGGRIGHVAPLAELLASEAPVTAQRSR
ncbi:phosphotransferase [Mycobacterium sp. 29Ha]|uniref:phosphotransferase n=1 Tax=Mycobacterium sp. 29Ha TaxID=2939268 RepID=UPI0029390127|nr:phosphotransferase [Mycobacterium sp. 29Ha]MDV3132069.1 phosphotransferase [Mycobacterium sp. 29Ha]